MTEAQSVWWALAVALALAAVHLVAPRLRELPGVPERAIGSFAGGTAVSYVFLHLLPDLAEGNEAIGEALEDRIDPTPLLDLAVFAVALLGFLTLYGLERLARRRAQEKARTDPPAGVFYVHLAAFGLLNALVAYTMPLRLRTDVAFAVLFSVAIGLHFVLTDRGMSETYPRRFSARGRYALAGALVLGWLAVAIAAPTSTLVVSLLTAFVGGFVLMNVFKEELPAERSSSFPWFLGGVLVYAALLAAATAASQ